MMVAGLVGCGGATESPTEPEEHIDAIYEIELELEEPEPEAEHEYMQHDFLNLVLTAPSTWEPDIDDDSAMFVIYYEAERTDARVLVGSPIAHISEDISDVMTTFDRLGFEMQIEQGFNPSNLQIFEVEDDLPLPTIGATFIAQVGDRVFNAASFMIFGDGETAIIHAFLDGAPDGFIDDLFEFVRRVEFVAPQTEPEPVEEPETTEQQPATQAAVVPAPAPQEQAPPPTTPPTAPAQPAAQAAPATQQAETPPPVVEPPPVAAQGNVGSIISAPTQARRNEILTVTFQGEPSTQYYLRVVSAAGNALTADGLGNSTSNADGIVSWTWLVGGRTGAGTQRLTITGGNVNVSHELLIIVD